MYLALFTQLALNCNGMRNWVCWFEISGSEVLSILLTGQAKYHAGNMGFKDLIIAYSGEGMLAVYKSLLGFSFHFIPQSGGNTSSNFSGLYIT